MIRRVILYIDTTKREKVSVGVEIDGELFEKQVDAKERRAQIVLPAIEELLREQKISLEQLTEIQVNAGPGSFTGTRVGVSVANALAWSLEIPVNGKKQILTPIYEKSKFD